MFGLLIVDRKVQIKVYLQCLLCCEYAAVQHQLFEVRTLGSEWLWWHVQEAC